MSEGSDLNGRKDPPALKKTQGSPPMEMDRPNWPAEANLCRKEEKLKTMGREGSPWFLTRKVHPQFFSTKRSAGEIICGTRSREGGGATLLQRVGIREGLSPEKKVTKISPHSKQKEKRGCHT